MKAEEYRSIIEDAIQGEIEAENFYVDLAARLKDAYLKNMFMEFSREETRHQTLLKSILSKESIRTYFHEDRDYKVAESTKTPKVGDIKTPADAFAVAMKNEEVAMKKYINLADNCSDGEMKKIFEDLAAMERDHKFKMEQAFVDIAYPEVW